MDDEQSPTRARSIWRRKPKNPSEDELRVWVDPELASGVDAGIGQEAGVDQSTGEVLYYYDLRTKQVLEGPRGSWQYRLGPYESPYDAARALSIAKQRNIEWEKQNKAWR